jgi:hypothetical protein
VAITDHDVTECAFRLHEISPSKIIVGEEIHTTAGEIIGLFLKKHINPGASPLETIHQIKDQGGLVYLPHPFDNMRGSVLKAEAREEVWEQVDIVEIYNSRNAFFWSNRKAMRFATEKGLLLGAGSDAHSRYELGKAHLVMEPFESASDFLKNLAKAEIRRGKTPVIYNLANKIYKIARGIG